MGKEKMKAFLVAGARPNFMKIAPIYRESLNYDQVECRIVHTGQHYDYDMSQAFFEDLEIPKPAFFLEAGSGTHSVQTAKIMVAFEELCQKERPDIVIVVGDVNSTLACSIVAKKLLIDVAHVEAGLRSFDLTMPEEINRMVTDSISDYFFVTEESGMQNLLNEGKPENRIHFVGHVMIDNLLYQAAKLINEDVSRFATYKLKKQNNNYVFLTMHRPSNVDSREKLDEIVSALNEISHDRPIVFTVHPRTRKMIDKFNVRFSDNITLLPPLGFKEALFLWKDAALVMTDSGGLQEETTALGVPCITLRENTERPITIEMGTNILAGTRKESILNAYRETMEKLGGREAGKQGGRENGGKKKVVPPKWDGMAAERIWRVLCG